MSSDSLPLPRSSTRGKWLWLAAATISAGVLAQTPQVPLPTFRAGVDIGHLDVSVYNADGTPLRGLNAADFTLTEDDKPRPIVAFAAVDIPPPPEPTAPWMVDVTSDVATNDMKDRRLFLLVIDDANIGRWVNPQSLSGIPSGPNSTMDAIKAAAIEFVRRMGPSDLVGVVFTGDNKKSQDFTTDHQRLIDTISHAHHVYVGPLAAQYAVDTVRSASEALIGTNGTRKAIVDFTDFNMPVTANDGDYLRFLTYQIFEEAEQAGVNVYTLSTHPAPELMDSFNAPTLWSARVPAETGGEAFSNLMDPDAGKAAVARIYEDNSVYYILGYSSAAIKDFHRLKVVVDRPGAIVRTRDKHYWPGTAKPPKGVPPPATIASMAGILPKSDLALHAIAVPFANDKGEPCALVVLTASQARRPGAAPPPASDLIDWRAAVFTREGDQKGKALPSSIQVRSRRTDTGADYDIAGIVSLPQAGQYELRFGAHSGTTDSDGGVYTTIDAPDFAHLRVSLSGVLLSTGARTIGGAEQIAGVVPVVPTIARDFARFDRVSAFLRVYEAIKAQLAGVAIHVRLVDDHDATVLDRTDQLAADRFGSAHAADEALDLPIATLHPGAYLLSFEVSLGADRAKREVRFSVH